MSVKSRFNMQPKIFSKILLGISAFIMSGCTQIGLGVANLPIKFSNNIEIKRDIAYGKEDWQKLDLYIPKLVQEKKLPVVIFFYGGRWTEGSKDMYGFIGEAFGESNYIVAIADYSKYPKVKFPSFVEDGALAVSWVHDNVAQYGWDKKNLFITGHSSGAHIGALIAADQSYLKKLGKNNLIITAFAGMAGPYDFIPEAEDLKDIFGPPEKYPQMQLTSFIEGDEPPMLLQWGEKDTAVIARNHKLLSEKIITEKGQVEVITYPDLDHVGTISALTWFYRNKQPILNDILKFFDKHKES